jgi:hypothetical protein
MEELLTELARRVQGKYYGKYRGFVDKNDDPDQLGRLKLRIPSVLGSEVTDWALPCVPYGGTAGLGLFVVPEEEAQVWVEFEEGDVRRPIWVGTFWQQKGDTPTDSQKSPPTTQLLQTKSGHILQFDDEDQKEHIRIFHKGGAELLVDENGTIKITDQAGNVLTLDAQNSKVTIEDTNNNALTMDSNGTKIADGNSNTIELSASGVKISSQQIVLDGQVVQLGGSGGEPVVKGQSFLQLYATHTHTAPPLGGPTSPPIPQGEPASSLSTAVQTK